MVVIYSVLVCVIRGSRLVTSAMMELLKSIPTHIDYAGQAHAEQLYKFIITLFSIVGLVWGYIVQQFSQSVYILGAGVILATLLTVPPWPMFRRKPLQWQPTQTGKRAATKKQRNKD